MQIQKVQQINSESIAMKKDWGTNFMFQEMKYGTINSKGFIFSFDSLIASFILLLMVFAFGKYAFSQITEFSLQSKEESLELRAIALIDYEIKTDLSRGGMVFSMNELSIPGRILFIPKRGEDYCFFADNSDCELGLSDCVVVSRPIVYSQIGTRGFLNVKVCS